MLRQKSSGFPSDLPKNKRKQEEPWYPHECELYARHHHAPVLPSKRKCEEIGFMSKPFEETTLIAQERDRAVSLLHGFIKEREDLHKRIESLAFQNESLLKRLHFLEFQLNCPKGHFSNVWIQ